MTVQNRKIACMTATRADYPRVKSVLKEIDRRNNLTLSLIVTGMHLEEAFGLTVREIEEDGFNIAARVRMYNGDDTPYGMAEAVGRVTTGIAEALRALNPDIFLITVDRAETLAAATAGALMNLPIAHIQGGEVTGTIDESIRHAVTKLCHLHFPATEDAAQRIIRMGEDPARVHVVGCPYVDLIKTLDYQSKDVLAANYGFKASKRIILFTQHPVTTEYGNALNQLRISISALKQFPDMEVLAFFPNADAGGQKIIELLKSEVGFHVFPNLHERDFLSLMNIADIMVGNSSAAIREAPSMGLPAVNIGSRQDGRERTCNIIDVPHEVKAIVTAMEKGLNDNTYRAIVRKIQNPYGDGFAAKRIVDVLEDMPLDSSLVQKRISY